MFFIDKSRIFYTRVKTKTRVILVEEKGSLILRGRITLLERIERICAIFRIVISLKRKSTGARIFNARNFKETPVYTSRV
jgi:hypothetical protein